MSNETDDEIKTSEISESSEGGLTTKEIICSKDLKKFIHFLLIKFQTWINDTATEIFGPTAEVQWAGGPKLEKGQEIIKKGIIKRKIDTGIACVPPPATSGPFYLVYVEIEGILYQALVQEKKETNNWYETERDFWEKLQVGEEIPVVFRYGERCLIMAE